MNPLPTSGLIVPTVVFVVLLLAAAFLVKFMVSFPPDPASAIVFSLILGFVGATCIVHFINGIEPFLHGARIPWLAFIIIWPLCSLFQIGSIELSGNVVIDALIVGFCMAGLCAIMSAGCWKVLNDGTWPKALHTWVIVGLFLSIIARAIYWAFE